MSSDAASPAAAGTVLQWRRAWYLYGRASHTFPTVVTTVFMSRYLTSVAENAVGTQGRVRPSASRSPRAARSSTR